MRIEIHNVWLFLLAFLSPFILIYVLIFLNGRRKKNKQRNESQAYRAKFVRQVMLTDAFLGTLETEYDTMTGTLTAENLKLPAFGSASPSAIHAEGYCEGMENTVLRLLNSVYRDADKHLRKLADAAIAAMRNAGQDELPDTEEIMEKIVVTEFQFHFSDDLQTTELMAGMETEDDTYTLSAVYDSDSGKWDYKANPIGGDAEIW